MALGAVCHEAEKEGMPGGRHWGLERRISAEECVAALGGIRAKLPA